MDHMKLIYVAGPYRAETEAGVHANIQAAEGFAIAILKMGAMPVCPHKNSAYLGGVVEDEVILKGDLELMQRCDAVFMMPSWRESSGATQEHDIARELGITRLFTLVDLQNWLEMGTADPAAA